jgi:hypothetical protein
MTHPGTSAEQSTAEAEPVTLRVGSRRRYYIVLAVCSAIFAIGLLNLMRNQGGLFLCALSVPLILANFRAIRPGWMSLTLHASGLGITILFQKHFVRWSDVLDVYVKQRSLLFRFRKVVIVKYGRDGRARILPLFPYLYGLTAQELLDLLTVRIVF